MLSSTSANRRVVHNVLHLLLLHTPTETGADIHLRATRATATATTAEREVDQIFQWLPIPLPAHPYPRTNSANAALSRGLSMTFRRTLIGGNVARTTEVIRTEPLLLVAKPLWKHGKAEGVVNAAGDALM